MHDPSSNVNETMKKQDINGPNSPHFQHEPAEAEVAQAEVAAWEEVEEGRFMPRRIRGSCQGRALG